MNEIFFLFSQSNNKVKYAISLLMTIVWVLYECCVAAHIFHFLKGGGRRKSSENKISLKTGRLR